ncbi:MAG: hypothetical protein ACI80N_003601, partial [Gammaproteobacteria bacterium]
MTCWWTPRNGSAEDSITHEPSDGVLVQRLAGVTWLVRNRV